MGFALCIALSVLASCAFAQNESSPPGPPALWEPPEWNFPENVKASVPKEMFSSFRLSGYDIALEETSMESVRKRFGGKIGRKGDAGDALEWLCFHGADATGGWVLWLESGKLTEAP